MSSVGSFGTFTTARLGIYVAQKGLSVTGNNIANINTIGYTRQRLDQVSFKTGGSDRYQNSYDMRVGNGAIAKSVSQLRDPYLDIRYRAEASSVGYHEGRLNGLNQIAVILDEIAKGEKQDGLLYAQFSDFFSALQHIQSEAGTEVNDTLAYTSADALAALFQSAAKRLDTLQHNTEVQLRQNVDDINNLLTSIRGLNETIRDAEIYGDNALELRDERNRYIDELSEQLKIDVTYTMEDIGLGKMVEKLTIRLGNSNPDKDITSDSSLLVDGNYCAQLTTPKLNDQYQAGYELFDKDSDAYKQALKDLKKGKEVANPEDANAPFKTQEELDAAIDAVLRDPDKAFLPFQYLDENGMGTNDPRQAEQKFDDHYNIYVSDLRDKNYKPWKDYAEARTIKPINQDDFPTRAMYSGEIKYSGVWKDGDIINVGGTQIVIGKDLSADDANNDPKNVANAIREALVNSGTYRDGGTPDGAALCNISTKTVKTADGVTISLNISTKAAGEGQTVTPPNITVTAAPLDGTKGSVTLGAPAEQANSNPKRYNVPVTTSNTWNKGDTILIGTAPNQTSLVVGKDISVNRAKDAKQLASALAGKLKVDGYTVTSTTDKDGNAQLVLTATDPNAQAPTMPNISVEAPKAITPPNGGNFLTQTVLTAGDTPKNPDGTPKVNLTPDPVVTDNGDNTVSTQIKQYYQDENGTWFATSMVSTTSKTKLLDDNDLNGKLQAVREILSEEGEFASKEDIALDENAAIKRGIPFYQQTLDLLARKFAETMNEANTGFAVDEKGNYLTESGEIIELEGEVLKKDALTDAQQAAIEQDALGNYIKANFAGFVKDAGGNDTNVLADKYGNALTVGDTQLTTENIKINGQTLKDLHFADINEDGKLVDTAGAVIGVDQTDPDNPVDLPIEFTDDAFGTVPTPADPANPTPEETEAMDKAQAEIDAKKDAATADLNDQALDSYLGANGGWKLGGNLFSNRGDTDDATGITASNISVSHSWSNGDVHVVPTFTRGEITNTTQNDNALHMGNLLNRDLVYNPQDLVDDALSNHLFEGSFQDMMVKMSTTLGNDQRATNVSLATHANQALDIDTSRDSVSAVDLNDEAMDLMQYTHSLNAAYRLMTTLDEMLERLITGTGVTR